MKTLHLLRHAKSDWDGPWESDSDRPLSPRGLRAAPRIGEYMTEHGVEPDLVLCSSARRTVETLEALGPAVPTSAEVQILDALYGASAGEMLALAAEAGSSASSILLIGHNPSTQQLAATLAGDDATPSGIVAKYPTAALASFEFADGDLGNPAGAALIRFVKPRDLE